MALSIVCGIDGSRQAQAALRVAGALAERLRLRLVLVHAVAAPGRDVPGIARGRVRVRGERIQTLRRENGERLLRREAAAYALHAEWRLAKGGGGGRLCGGA